MTLALTPAQTLRLWHEVALTMVRDDDPDLSLRQTGILFTIYLVTYMLGQFLAAWLSRRVSNRRQLLIGMSTSIACNAAIGALLVLRPPGAYAGIPGSGEEISAAKRSQRNIEAVVSGKTRQARRPVPLGH